MISAVAQGKPLAWADVMAGLTGRRLAIYDDLLRGKTPGQEERGALDWLAVHRWIWRDGAGIWRARLVSQARELWEAHGAAAAEAITNRPGERVTADPEPVAHMQQVSWF